MMKQQLLKRYAKVLALSAVLVTTLSGCAELLIGGAVMSAVSAADRRTIGSQAEDKAILLKANNLVTTMVGNAGQIEVTSYNRKVLLTGTVINENLKNEVEKNIAAIPNVSSVTNDIAIGDYAQSLGSRSQDTLVTTKVRAALAHTPHLQSSAIKVVTVRAQVYLLGLVTLQEAQMATDVVRQVGGVEKVFKMFEYISESQIPQGPAPTN